ELAVGAVSCLEDHAGVLERVDRPAVGRVPDPRRPVPGSAGQPPPVGAERQAVDQRGEPGGGAHSLPPGPVPALGPPLRTSPRRGTTRSRAAALRACTPPATPRRRAP